MAVVKTYNGSVKAVGEKVILNFAKSDVTANVDDDFDFLLDDNFYVTGMSVTKTSADMLLTTPGTNRLFVTLLRVPSTGTVGATDVIAQAGFFAKDGSVVPAPGTAIANGSLGQKAIAGVPGLQSNALAAAETPVFVASAMPAAAGTDNTTWLDPNVKLQANSSIASTTNSKQRMRIKVTSTTAGDTSCFIVVYLARYTQGITEGAVANSNQIEEVLVPVLV